MTIDIAPLSTAEEIDDILAVEAASFSNPWTRDMYVAELDNRGVAHFLLARDETRRMIGFCSFWLVLDELHINNLAVLPDVRRKGVATALLGRTLAEGRRRGAKRATLEVRRSNEIAQRLYERFGFFVSGVRKGYYTHPSEDALVLWKDGV